MEDSRSMASFTINYALEGSLIIQLIVAHWHNMATGIWVKIGSGNALLPEGPKPLPESMLTDHQWSPVTVILGQFHKRWLNHQSQTSILKSCFENFIQISQGQMS